MSGEGLFTREIIVVVPGLSAPFSLLTVLNVFVRGGGGIRNYSHSVVEVCRSKENSI